MSENKNLPFKRDAADNQTNAELKQSKGVIYFSHLQESSNACKKSAGDKYVEGADPGDFMIGTVNRVLKGDVDVIVLDFFRFVVEENPNDWKDVKGRYTYADAIKNHIANPGAWSGEWESHKGNKMVLNYGYVLQIVGHEDVGPVSFNLKNAGVKSAEKWNSLLDRQLPGGGNAATYHQVFTLKSKAESNNRGSFFVISPEFKDWVNQEQYDSAMEKVKELPKPQDAVQLEDKSEGESNSENDKSPQY